MSPIVEIVNFKASEALLVDPTSAHSVLQYFRNAGGCLSVAYGFQVEDEKRMFILITWNTFESSEKLQQADYTPLLSLASGPISIRHIEFSADTKTAFSAPVTEITTIKAKEGQTQQDVSAVVSRIRENQHLVKGGHPPIAWGQVKETPEFSVLIIGWDSIEVHFLSYGVAPIDKITVDLISICEPDTRHVVLTSS